VLQDAGWRSGDAECVGYDAWRYLGARQVYYLLVVLSVSDLLTVQTVFAEGLAYRQAGAQEKTGLLAEGLIELGLAQALVPNSYII
jgi:hypothetical protein